MSLFTRVSVGILALSLAAPVSAAPSDDKDDKDDEAEGKAETISLAKLVKLAVTQSSTLALARANRAKADLDQTIADAPDEVQITASLNVVKKSQDIIPNARAQIIGDTSLASQFGFSKRVTTGGSLSVSFTNTQQSRRYAEDPINPAVANISVAEIDLAQPLLRGLGMGARINEQRSALNASSATLSALDAGAATLRNIINSYWELAYARANLAVREQSLKLAREQAEVAKKLADRGAIPETGLKSSLYQLALREEAVLRAQRDLETGSLALRRLAGMEIAPDQIDLVPTDAITAGAEATKKYDVEKMLDLAMAKSPVIAASKVGVDLANVTVSERENGVLPGLDLTVGAGGVGVGTGVGDSFGKLSGFVNYQVSAGLAFRWEIGGAARAAADRARIDRTTAKRTAKDIERDTIAQVVNAVHDVKAAQARMEVTKRAIDLATSTLSVELSLFKAEKSTAVALFQKQTDLEDARLLEIRAQVDFQEAITSLDYLTGRLLDKYGVELVEK